MNHQKTPLVLLILDGWGMDKAHPYNAIEAAVKPQWDTWWQTMPHGLLDASGEAVGLPHGQMGNSEVGHVHIGAGRLIPQDLTRINQIIHDGRWGENKVLNQLLTPVDMNLDTADGDNKLNCEQVSEQAQKPHRLHVMGLLSPGGVHSHEKHLIEFLTICKQRNCKNIALHLFLDGRDTPPQSAMQSIMKLEKVLKKTKVGRIASICGRYFAMDRDNRWERTQQTYDLLTLGVGKNKFKDVEAALNKYYGEQCTDEFIPPTVIGEPVPMCDGDSVFFFNYRSDRARTLTQALTLPEFTGFDRQTTICFQQFVTMTTYQAGLPVNVMFPSVEVTHTLGEILANNGLKQLRLAETEKYAHVTFFLNGGQEAPYTGEDRILVPSPNVATYDLQPDMSAQAITEKLLTAINASNYDVILCNYANADMVGHTGDMQATTEAISCLDRCMAQVGKAVKAANGVLLITADHGNAEVMYDDQIQQPHTAHTNNFVPFLFVGESWVYRGGVGCLSDVAPTILSLLGLEKPRQMTGKTLLVKA